MESELILNKNPLLLKEEVEIEVDTKVKVVDTEVKVAEVKVAEVKVAEVKVAEVKVVDTEVKVAEVKVAEVKVAEVKVVDTNLQKAKKIYNDLQEDIQRFLIDDFITPELNGNHLIKEFDKVINSEECQRLKWQVLTDVVGKIIKHSGALSQMFELNTLGFKDSYKQHFIDGIMTFKHPDWNNKPLESMCAELTMRKWH